MQIKAFNTYKIIHKNGHEEVINAEDLSTALQNMVVSEETSPVISVFMQSEDVRTILHTEAENETDDNEDNDNTTNEDTDVTGEVEIEGNV